MAKWDKLNRELKSALNQMTKDDWKDWHTNRKANRELRQGVFQLEAEMHLAKMLLADSEYKDAFVQEDVGQQTTQADLTYTHIIFESFDKEEKELPNSNKGYTYAIAA